MALRNFLILRRSRSDRLEGRSALVQPAAKQRQASRGAWLTLGGAFAAFTVGAGIMHSYTVFLVAFIEEFQWSRAETSIAYSVSQLVAGASSPLVGGWSIASVRAGCCCSAAACSFSGCSAAPLSRHSGRSSCSTGSS